MITDSDLDIFLAGEFAQEVTLRPDEPEEATVQAIFDNEHRLVDVDAGAEIISTEPTVRVKSADVAELSQGDRVVVAGTAYLINEIRPDGTGFSDVTLIEED